MESIRVMRPLFQAEEDGSIPISTLHARDLKFGECQKTLAVTLTLRWHSRLPNTQQGPWEFAFAAEYNGIVYGVALCNTPSGRCLPQHWIELRRMALSPDAPKNSASRFLSWMARWFQKHYPQREMLISYQDTAVHRGTIYKAAGWIKGPTSKARVRDRSKVRIGTTRFYRSNINGQQTDASPKTRWEYRLTHPLAQRTR